MVTSESNDEFDALVRLSEEELYAHLGEWLLPDSSTLGPGDIKRNVDIGKAWIANHLDELHDAICSDHRIVYLRKQAETDTADWVGAIADILSAKGGYPPLAVVSTLTFRYGIDRLCP